MIDEPLIGVGLRGNGYDLPEFPGFPARLLDWSGDDARDRIEPFISNLFGHAHDENKPKGFAIFILRSCLSYQANFCNVYRFIYALFNVNLQRVPRGTLSSVQLALSVCSIAVLAIQ